MGELGAAGFHTISDEERELTKEEWDEERFGMLCTKAENFANWKAALLKLCNVTRMCNYSTKKKIQNLSNRIQDFQLKIEDITARSSEVEPLDSGVN